MGINMEHYGFPFQGGAGGGAGGGDGVNEGAGGGGGGGVIVICSPLIYIDTGSSCGIKVNGGAGGT